MIDTPVASMCASICAGDIVIAWAARYWISSAAVPAAYGVAIEVPHSTRLVEPFRPVEVMEQPGASMSSSSPVPCTGVALLKHDTLSGSALSVHTENAVLNAASPTEPTPTAPVTQPGLLTWEIEASLPVATKTVTPCALSVENAARYAALPASHEAWFE